MKTKINNKMEKVTKTNLITLIELKKEYAEVTSENIKNEIRIIINNYIDNVINKDKSYYKKLQEFNFNNEELKYLL